MNIHSKNNIILAWIPSRIGIHRNERADKAKQKKKTPGRLVFLANKRRCSCSKLANCLKDKLVNSCFKTMNFFSLLLPLSIKFPEF